MIFKMYNCDFSVTIAGTIYTFTHVDGLQIEDPERTRLIRGANAGDTAGLAYRENLKEAKTITLTVIGMTAAVHDLLKKTHADQTRLEVNCIDKIDGSSKIAKEAILAQPPRQLNLNDNAESMNVALIFESFNIEEVHKT